MLLASIPSPSQAVWHLGPLPLRAYALCIIAGVVAAIWLGERRWVARGGRAGTVSDIAVWAVPFGVVGGRIYHVITDAELYFGAGRRPVEALYIWNGGLGIWGAIALGGVGAYVGTRRAGVHFPAMADALAPGILLAQAIGRFGNYFNQELFGRPTDLPWGLEIAPANRPAGYEDVATFQPTFLYESLWAVAAVLLLLAIDRRGRIGHGRLFALYVAFYTAGRGWIEELRIDDAHQLLGLRLNTYTSIVLFVLAVAYVVVVGRRRPGREEVVQEPPPTEDTDDVEDAGPTDDTDASDAADSGDPDRTDDTDTSDAPDDRLAADATGDDPASGTGARHP